MKDILKRFGLFFLGLLFLEIVFSVVIYSKLDIDKLINVTLYTIIISAFLSIITGVFSDKVNVIITSIILFIIGAFFSAQLVFFNVFKAYISLSILGLGDQLNGFMNETIAAIVDNMGYIFIMLIPFVSYLVFKKYLKLTKNTLKSYLTYLVVMIFGIGLYVLYIQVTKSNENST